MHNSNSHITLFVLITTGVIFLLSSLIISLLYLYKTRQLKYLTHLTDLKASYEKNILESQIEMQEQTFRHISREIHDNINLSLTLAKLNLNTIDYESADKLKASIKSSVSIIGSAISDLTNISRSLNPEVIRNVGFHNAVNNEIARIQEIAHIHIKYRVDGDPIFIESEKELVIFRMIQEAFNNILKYAQASVIDLYIKYSDDEISIVIKDNGIGFDHSSTLNNTEKSGLISMKTRTQILGGHFEICSSHNKGTRINIKIPF